MKTKPLYAALIGVFVFAALFLLCPAAAFAQKDKEQTTPEKALEALRKYEIPGDFYDRLQAQETGWRLTQFFPPHPADSNKKTFGLDFQKGNNKVRVYIYEYDSAEKATELSIHKIHISSGLILEYNRYGDEGRKIHGNSGFSSLSFIKNRFAVSIHCDDEKTAERFAGYASGVFSSRMNA
jgi:hypothetical protein